MVVVVVVLPTAAEHSSSAWGRWCVERAVVGCDRKPCIPPMGTCGPGQSTDAAFFGAASVHRPLLDVSGLGGGGGELVLVLVVTSQQRTLVYDAPRTKQAVGGWARRVAVLDSSRTIPFSAPMLAQARQRAAL